MGESEKDSARDPSDDHVNVNIYSQRKFVFSTVLSSSLEFGRQRVDEMEPF